MTLQEQPEKNLNYYRIDGVIDFDPNSHVLYNRSTGKNFALFAPASRCLHLLIRKQNIIVSQKELMQEGWKSLGLVVSTNAYYQNIAHIRRAFSELLPNHEIITTIKRVGLVIEAEINITALSVNEFHARQNELIFEEIQRDAEYEANTRDVKNKRPFWIPSILFLLSISMLIAAGFFYDSTMSKNLSYFNYYFLYKKNQSGCLIYLNKDGARNVDISSLTPTGDFNCKGYERAYVTHWSNWPRTSIMYCTSDVLNRTDLTCVTDFYGNEFP